MMLAGVVVIAAGSGLYIGAGLGPGPRDGLDDRARPSTACRSTLARTGIELLVLLAGVALGGSIGIGTAVFALGIGPMVQIFLPPPQHARTPARPPASTSRPPQG